jgi:hypothetical protein
MTYGPDQDRNIAWFGAHLLIDVVMIVGRNAARAHITEV